MTPIDKTRSRGTSALRPHQAATPLESLSYEYLIVVPKHTNTDTFDPWSLMKLRVDEAPSGQMQDAGLNPN